MPTHSTHLRTNPDAVVAEAKRDDRVVVFVGRIGARPFFRYVERQNRHNRPYGTWVMMSVYPKRLAGGLMWAYPRIVEPDQEDYPVNEFTDEWVKSQVMKSRGVELWDPEDTPFGGCFDPVDDREDD